MRQHIDGTAVAQADQQLWDDIRERVTSEDDSDAERDRLADEWFGSHTPAEAIAEWFGWNFGDPSWGPTLMRKLRLLMSCDAQYQLRVDHDAEVLLGELLGGKMDE